MTRRKARQAAPVEEALEAPAKAPRGRPHRAAGEATTTLGLRLTEAERGRLQALAARWGCSEADAARRAIELAARGR